MKMFPHLLRHAEFVSASILKLTTAYKKEEWTLKQVQGDGFRI